MLTADLKALCLLWGVVLLLCFVAPLVDLGSGLVKARQRGERVTSYGLHRTVIKIITYDGSVLLAGCIDILLHHAHFWQLIGLDLLHSVPVVTIIMGIFNIFVEMISVRERADKKADKRAKAQLQHLIELFTADEVTKLLQVLDKVKSDVITDDSSEEEA